MEQSSTVEKAIDVLFHLHQQAGPLGVSQVARALGMPKSSTHRLLSALVRRGLVERNGRGKYELGIALVTLAFGMLDREPLVAAGHSVLERHANDLGETFFLVGPRNRKLVVLDKAEGNGLLRVSPRVGATIPMHATAVGKLYLASEPELLSALTEPFERFTARTPTNRDELQQQVQRARQLGYALNCDEWIEGLSVAAAPISSPGGGDQKRKMAGAVAAALPSPRMAGIGEAKVVERAVAAANEIAARLEGRGVQS